MPSKYPLFDRARLRILPLSERANDLDISRCLALDEEPPAFNHPDLPQVASRWADATRSGAARILMMGAHVLRAGNSRLIIDLIERGAISLVATNGAGLIHDYELARIGATTESVARYISEGQFGLWRETGELNDWMVEAARAGMGWGEYAGKRIAESAYQQRELSVAAAAWKHNVPFTVHCGIGYDILHEHPNCDGAALGAVSYTDFLIFTAAVENLEGGLLLNFGSAIMGPEVFLKALAMSRNVARREGRSIRRFTIAVCDMVPIQGDYHRELPKSDPGYYFRPHKTMLVRTVADGGESFYLQGDHRATFPALRKAYLRASGVEV